MLATNPQSGKLGPANKHLSTSGPDRSLKIFVTGRAGMPVEEVLGVWLRGLR
jgi:hypothetical protein